MPKLHVNLIPREDKLVEIPQRFPRMPALNLKLIENKKKVKEEFLSDDEDEDPGDKKRVTNQNKSKKVKTKENGMLIIKKKKIPTPVNNIEFVDNEESKSYDNFPRSASSNKPAYNSPAMSNTGSIKDLHQKIGSQRSPSPFNDPLMSESPISSPLQSPLQLQKSPLFRKPFPRDKLIRSKPDTETPVSKESNYNGSVDSFQHRREYDKHKAYKNYHNKYRDVSSEDSDDDYRERSSRHDRYKDYDRHSENKYRDRDEYSDDRDRYRENDRDRYRGYERDRDREYERGRDRDRYRERDRDREYERERDRDRDRDREYERERDRDRERRRYYEDSEDDDYEDRRSDRRNRQERRDHNKRKIIDKEGDEVIMVDDDDESDEIPRRRDRKESITPIAQPSPAYSNLSSDYGDNPNDPRKARSGSRANDPSGGSKRASREHRPKESEEDNKKIKREYLQKYEILKAAYSDEVFPKLAEFMDTEFVINTYETEFKRVTTKANLNEYKMYMFMLFFAFEYGLKYTFDVDTYGFVKQQLKFQHKYDKLLVQLGEREYMSFGTNWPAELKITIMFGFHVLIFFVSKQIGKKFGETATNAIQDVLCNVGGTSDSGGISMNPMVGLFNMAMSGNVSKSAAASEPTQPMEKKVMRGPTVNLEDL